MKIHTHMKVQPTQHVNPGSAESEADRLKTEKEKTESTVLAQIWDFISCHVPGLDMYVFKTSHILFECDTGSYRVCCSVGCL